MLTLSGEPRPVYSILCDSPTQLPPSAKTAFCVELAFNNLSSESELFLASVCSVAQLPSELPGYEGFVTPAGWSSTDLASFTASSFHCEVEGPPAAGAFRERPSKPTTFRKFYERGEFPNGTGA
ncbi:unnamed protein product [Pleuronectes platessa]|uniref:Uncharacterized protein n=1 Tax=Pleuronectes platessa TaxID=8262 RepID=A0A9N7V2C9_PLEPL|nr:unnamed protein product [Pleuronectes platessa]